jgi:multiple sugar transport system permease protein
LGPDTRRNAIAALDPSPFWRWDEEGRFLGGAGGIAALQQAHSGRSGRVMSAGADAATDESVSAAGWTGPYPDWFGKRRRRANLIVSPVVPWIMVGAPVLILVAIVVYPTIWMAYHAFQDTNMMSLFTGEWAFVGWQNFSNALTDDRFIDSVWNLIRYLLFGACLQVVLGTVLALILYEVVRSALWRNVILILLVLPMMLPPSIVGVLWKFLLQANNGGLNHLLIALGILDPAARIDWLSAQLSLWSITLVDVWQWTALPLLIVYSGRVSLPPAVYEAARVDGASGWLVLRRITLPMLKEIIAIAFIIRFMDAYKFVDHVSVMTQGGPAESSELPVFIAFQKGIREFQVGEAAAQAWLIFVVAMVLITLFLKYLKRVLKAQAFA